MCELLESDSAVSKRHEWSYPAPIASIEISSGDVAQPQLIAGLAVNAESTHVDSGDPMRARWHLEIKNRKRSARLVFLPLDLRGVEFVLRLPDAGSRLDNQD